MQLLANILPWIQAGLAILLGAAILLQRSEEGLGSAFGSSNMGGVFYAKRGLEKQLFIATIILAILFIVTSILMLVL